MGSDGLPDGLPDGHPDWHPDGQPDGQPAGPAMPPTLQLTRADLLAHWVSRLPPDIGQTVIHCHVADSRRYALSGELILRYPDARRPGKTRHGRLRFRLIASRSFFRRPTRYVVRHFVSAMSPRALTGQYAPAFLKVVLGWLGERGFDEARFPIHFRRRCAAFEARLRALGFECEVVNRWLFKVIVVRLVPERMQ